jgi:hypothetical protein
MVRKIGAILAGLIVFAALEFIATSVAKDSWPAYALAAPSRAYTLDMLLTRLGAGALGSLVAGAFSAKIDQSTRQSALIFGIILLAISVVWHIRIWEQYPVWYHLSWFACTVPFSALGGLLVRREVAP